MVEALTCFARVPQSAYLPLHLVSHRGDDAAVDIASILIQKNPETVLTADPSGALAIHIACGQQKCGLRTPDCATRFR